jgi:hypothetical protein
MKDEGCLGRFPTESGTKVIVLPLFNMRNKPEKQSLNNDNTKDHLGGLPCRVLGDMIAMYTESLNVPLVPYIQSASSLQAVS